MTECVHSKPLQKQGGPGKDGPTYAWACRQCGTRWQRGWTLSQIAEMEADRANVDLSTVTRLMKEAPLDMYTEGDVKWVRGLIYSQITMIGKNAARSNNPPSPSRKSESRVNVSTGENSGPSSGTSSVDIREAPSTVMKKRVVNIGQEENPQTGMPLEVQTCETYYQDLLARGISPTEAVGMIISESHGSDVTVVAEWIRLKRREGTTGKFP